MRGMNKVGNGRGREVQVAIEPDAPPYCNDEEIKAAP
jgi:hypothetical protein